MPTGVGDTIVADEVNLQGGLELSTRGGDTFMWKRNHIFWSALFCSLLATSSVSLTSILSFSPPSGLSLPPSGLSLVSLSLSVSPVRCDCFFGCVNVLQSETVEAGGSTALTDPVTYVALVDH